MTLPTPEPTFDNIQMALMQLWGVVNRLSQIPPPQCDRYRVSIFGSARIKPEDQLYQDVKQLAKALTELGCDIVTGGGPGLMQAANEGSVEGDPEEKRDSIGIRIALDFEQSSNPFVEQLYTHETFFSRLHQFVLLSQAFIVVPGGIGTTLEMAMIWQLLQVRKIDQVPLILVGDMWRSLVDWAEQSMVKQSHPQLANPADMHIPICVPTMEQAIELIQTEKEKWTAACKL